MRQTPLFSGFIYIILGCLFTYLAIHNVSDDGWNFLSYFLVILATFDFGAGIRLIALHFKLKKIINKK